MVEMSLTVGEAGAEPLETAVLVNSITGLVRWFFFGVIAVGAMVIYIKKKNADSGQNKHS